MFFEWFDMAAWGLGWFPNQGLADDEMRLSWQECGFDCQTVGKDGLHPWWFACFYPEV